VIPWICIRQKGVKTLNKFQIWLKRSKFKHSGIWTISHPYWWPVCQKLHTVGYNSPLRKWQALHFWILKGKWGFYSGECRNKSTAGGRITAKCKLETVMKSKKTVDFSHVHDNVWQLHDSISGITTSNALTNTHTHNVS